MDNSHGKFDFLGKNPFSDGGNHNRTMGTNQINSSNLKTHGNNILASNSTNVTPIGSIPRGGNYYPS